MDDLDMATELEARDREEALTRAHQGLLQCGPEIINGVPCCRECGEPIPKKRLEALPGVALCITCQEEREARRR
ncbi:MAG: TraR/DksA family transcriptional regulator [Desulfovibrionaceae bacterium]|nr:TraR/DksA family transcriptional regulator [Desulfovibrionaceae bacterium]